MLPNAIISLSAICRASEGMGGEYWGRTTTTVKKLYGRRLVQSCPLLIHSAAPLRSFPRVNKNKAGLRRSIIQKHGRNITPSHTQPLCSTHDYECSGGSKIFEKGGRKTIYQLRPHLSQMRTTKYMPFTRKKAAFWKIWARGGGRLPPLNPPETHICML